jgi:hypothetical protein
MPGFFKDAEALAKLKHQVNTTLAAPAEQQGKLAVPLLKQIEKAKETSVDPAFLDQLDTFSEQVAGVTPVEAAKPGKSGKEKKK